MSDVVMDTSWDEIPEDRTLPVGHWVMKNVGFAYIKPKKEGNSPTLGFFYSPVKPLGDVDKKALKELGDYDFTQNEIPIFLFFGKRDKAKVFAHLMKHEDFEMPEGTARETIESGKLRKALDGTMVVAKLGFSNDRKNEAGEAIEENTIEAVFELSEFDQ